MLYFNGDDDDDGGGGDDDDDDDDDGWKLESIDSLLKRIRKTGTVVRQPGSGRPCSARSSGGPCAQSGGQAKKASVNSLDFT